MSNGVSVLCNTFTAIPSGNVSFGSQTQVLLKSFSPLGRYPDVKPQDKSFVFGGGEKDFSKTCVWLPNEMFPDGIAVNVLHKTETPLLIGTDMLRYYGMVLDYAHDTVYSHRLKRDIPCIVLPSGHIAISMIPEEGKY